MTTDHVEETPMTVQATTSDDDMPCEMPPVGWTCSRGAGHDGPCAASPRAGATKYERAVLEAMAMRAIQQRDEALAAVDAARAELTAEIVAGLRAEAAPLVATVESGFYAEVVLALADKIERREIG